MRIDYKQFEDAVYDNKQTEALKESAIKVLSNHQGYGWLLLFGACQYLFHFYAETGEYDKKIIDGLENAFSSGLNFKSNSEKLLEAKKIQSRLFFKYSNYRKACSSLLILIENADPSSLPDWVFNYSAKVDIQTEKEYYLLEPDKLLKKIPLVNFNDQQRVSIYKEFLRLAYDHYLDNGKLAAASFIRRVAPYIEGHLELFGDEWQALNGLIEKTEPEQLAQIDIDDLIRSNNVLQEDNDELRQIVFELEAELKKLKGEYEKLLDEQKKQKDDFKQIISTIRDGRSKTSGEREFVPKILVIGTSDVKDQNIFIGAERSFGIPRKNIDINNDYKKNKRFSIKTLLYNSKYDGILIGPIAHKVCDMGDNNSLIQALKQEGYPPIEEVRTKSGRLKITNTSIKEAMDNLLTKISSNIPFEQM